MKTSVSVNGKGSGKGRWLTWNLVRIIILGGAHLLRTQAALFLDNTLNPKCNECQSIDIDPQFKKVFGILVCNKCKQDKPDKYSLLTKTECKEVSRALYPTGS